MSSSTPALEQLAGVYLNEDWVLDYKTWEAAVDAFITESPDEASLLSAEIKRVLIALDSDEELRDYVFALGAAYDAAPQNGGYRAWLTEIAHRVEATTV